MDSVVSGLEGEGVGRRIELTVEGLPDVRAPVVEAGHIPAVFERGEADAVIHIVGVALRSNFLKVTGIETVRDRLVGVEPGAGLPMLS